MGKSIRCKVKKRLRTAKRQRVDAMICTPREHEKHDSLRKVIEGRAVTLSKPRNAFRYPNGAESIFPQHEVMKPIDYRPEALPMAAFAHRGNRRKYEGEQLEYQVNLSKKHPKMEVLAGGGAVLASTGQKVTLREAEIIATAQKNPEAARSAAAPPSAASAVSAAVMEEPVVVRQAMPDPQPQNEADHTRPPVLKDERRAKRAAAHRSRPKSSAKKTVNPAAPVKEAPVKKKIGKNKKDAAGDVKM